MFIRRWRARRNEQRTGKRLPRDWYGVALDLAVVVAGVYLGIALGNWNEDRADARELSEFEAVLWQDLRLIEFGARQRVSTAKCRTNRIATLVEALSRPEQAWSALDPYPLPSNLTPTIPPVLLSPVNTWPYRNWDAARERGLVYKLDSNRINALDVTMNNVERMMSLQFDIHDDIAGLSALAFDTTLSRTERNLYIDRLGQIDVRDRMMTIVSQQTLTSLSRLKSMPRPDGARVLPVEQINESNARTQTALGDCFKPIEMSYFVGRGSGPSDRNK